MAKNGGNKSSTNSGGLDFESNFWAAADKLRGHMDASEYKHVCLGLIFLKYISDAFEEKREQLLFGFSDPKSDDTTWKLARMNLAIRGIDGNLGPRIADSFRADLHPDLKADFILANPPFNMSAWGGESLRQDLRWKFGMPPVNNANYAWIQHFIHHLSPVDVAGFVMANGSMSTQTSNEGEIRKALIEADLVDCMVALPGQGPPHTADGWIRSTRRPLFPSRCANR
jgi:type I restriction-modification system DNA methylase subunit